jgi:very-short-patch-repair endonuclease
MGVPSGTIDEWLLAGLLHAVYPGVYAVGHPVLAPRAALLAAVLACGPTAVLSHRSAAELWNLIEIREGFVIQVTVPGHGIEGPSGIYVHRTSELSRWERDEVDGIPVTSAARTIFDFASQAGRGEIEAAYERGLIDDRYTRDDMIKMAVRHKGRRRITEVRRLIDRDAPPSVTIKEAHRMLLELVRSSSLPHPKTEFPIGRFRADVCWPEAKLIVEMDSSKWHNTPGRIEHDKRRDAELAADGWMTIRVTWNDLTKHPIATVSRLAAIYATRAPSRS